MSVARSVCLEEQSTVKLLHNPPLLPHHPSRSETTPPACPAPPAPPLYPTPHLGQIQGAQGKLVRDLTPVSESDREPSPQPQEGRRLSPSPCIPRHTHPGPDLLPQELQGFPNLYPS